MSNQHANNQLPTSSRLLQATAAAAIAASVILVAAVLPAEYGIDPTGLGGRLGLLALAAPAPVAASAAAVPVAPATS